MTEPQRRCFPRVHVKCPVEMGVRHSSHPVRWDGPITEVSEGGVFVEIGGDHSVGTDVMLRFGFPLIDEVLCTGVVRHHKPGVGIGVEFLRLSDTDRGHIGGLRDGGKATMDHDADMLRREYIQQLGGRHRSATPSGSKRSV